MKFENVRLTISFSLENLESHLLTFIFNLGLETVQTKEVEIEADRGIEIKTEEKEGVLLVRKKVIKLETVKNLEEEEEEGLDLDLIQDLLEDLTEETIPDPILEKGEDQEEETQEIEDQDHLTQETVKVAEMIDDLLGKEKETIEVSQDLRLSAKRVETDGHSEETQEIGNQLVTLGLSVKKAKRENMVSEKAFQEVTL